MSQQQTEPEGEATPPDSPGRIPKAAKFVFFGVLIVSVALAIWFKQNRNHCLTDPQQFERARALWRTGELTILVRHTEKCSAVSGACAEGDKGITPRGIEQAKQIGKAIAKFGPAVKRILYSPTDRTKQTARTAFGEQTKPANWLVGDCKKDFIAQIKAEKKLGENLILVTHSSCLNSLKDELNQSLLPFNAGKDQYFGVALLFDVPNTDTADYLTCVLPSSWPVTVKF